MKASSLLRIAGAIVALACLAFFIVKATEAWQGIGPTVAPGSILTKLAAAAGPIVLGYAAAATAWIAVLRSLGLRIPLVQGMGIFLTTQLAKYVPGKVGHYASRVALSAQQGYPPATIALSLTMETMLLLSVAAILSLPMLGIVVREISLAWTGTAVIEVSVAALLIVAAATATWFYARRKWPFLPGLARERMAHFRGELNRPTAAIQIASATLLLAASIALTSISMLSLDAGLLGLRPSEVAAAVSLYSVAWIAGALTPGVPAGLGVREAILIQGMSPLLGAEQAVSTALLLRLLTTLADATAFGVGLMLLRVTPASLSSDST